MIAVLQRVSRAVCTADGQYSGECGHGLLILLCAVAGDDEEDCRLLADKIVKLRIFPDENGRMNRSLLDNGYGALLVSNFTLAANYTHGNRPDFMAAEKPPRAKELYQHAISLFCQRLGQDRVGTGVFGADMQLDMTADGPVTVIMDSALLKKKAPAEK